MLSKKRIQQLIVKWKERKNKNNDDYPYTVMKEMFNAIIKTASWLEQVLHLTSQINCHIASTMIYVTKQDRLHSYQDIYWQVVSMSTQCIILHSSVD